MALIKSPNFHRLSSGMVALDETKKKAELRRLDEAPISNTTDRFATDDLVTLPEDYDATS